MTGGFDGNDCVLAVFWSALCGTGRSSIPYSGFPVSRSRRYVQPVFPVSPIACVVRPFAWTSKRTTGLGAS